MISDHITYNIIQHLCGYNKYLHISVLIVIIFNRFFGMTGFTLIKH